MKLAKKAEVTVKDNPRVLERVIWQDVRVAAEREAIHPDWSCALYSLHRLGRLNAEQREAGDRYGTLVRDFRKLWEDKMGKIVVYRDPYYECLERRSPLTRDVEFLLSHVVANDREPESEFEMARAKRISKRYREAAGVAGPARNLVEDLVVNDIWPVGERGHKIISHALTRLFHFFTTGTKRKHRK